QWKGGGVVFAPKPRDYSFKLNKKEKQIALKSVLSSKVENNKLIVLDELNFDEIKTKSMVNVLNNLNANKALIVLGEKNDNVYLSARNIPSVRTVQSNSINVYDILKYDTLVLTKDAVEKIEEVYA
ncbi:MAG TPA: 50S ribosomal protein L4, partial [Clostridiales bacterium]|nr:50S ribosomal protein L4 [Clostridiales bacterium]